MRRMIVVLVSGVWLACMLSSTPAQAHGYGRGGGFRGSFGLYFGGPGPFFYGPPPAYPYPYAYSYPYVVSPPPVIVQPPQPQVYIEQDSNTASSAAGSSNFWYYCEASAAYYPYIKECPSGWKQVPASPPPAVANP